MVKLIKTFGMLAALLGGKEESVIDALSKGFYDKAFRLMMLNMTGYNSSPVPYITNRFDLSKSMIDVALLTSLISEGISAIGAPSADIGKLHLEL